MLHVTGFIIHQHLYILLHSQCKTSLYISLYIHEWIYIYNQELSYKIGLHERKVGIRLYLSFYNNTEWKGM